MSVARPRVARARPIRPAQGLSVGRRDARLGPTDHKCQDLLRERAAVTGSELAAITGLTTHQLAAIAKFLARTTEFAYRHVSSDDRDEENTITATMMTTSRQRP